jgi:hypothetical protein
MSSNHILWKITFQVWGGGGVDWHNMLVGLYRYDIRSRNSTTQELCSTCLVCALWMHGCCIVDISHKGGGGNNSRPLLDFRVRTIKGLLLGFKLCTREKLRLCLVRSRTATVRICPPTNCTCAIQQCMTPIWAYSFKGKVQVLNKSSLQGEVF